MACSSEASPPRDRSPSTRQTVRSPRRRSESTSDSTGTAVPTVGRSSADRSERRPTRCEPLPTGGLGPCQRTPADELSRRSRPFSRSERSAVDTPRARRRRAPVPRPWRLPRAPRSRRRAALCTAQALLVIVPQARERRRRCLGQRTNDHRRPRKIRRHSSRNDAQAPSHEVADDGPADGFRDDESDTKRRCASRIGHRGVLETVRVCWCGIHDEAP